MKNLASKIIRIALAVFSVIVININLTNDMNRITYNNGNSIITVCLLILLIIGVKFVENIKNKRLFIITTILGILLAIFEVLGQAINQNLDLSMLYCAKRNIVISISMVISYAYIITTILIIVYSKIESIQYVKNSRSKSKIIWLIIPWILILLAWIPYLLTYFPGNITPDSVAQIDQAAGISNYSNHHPFFHTLLIKLTIEIGLLINNNYNTGIAIYSICQMITLSGIFAFSIYYMTRKNVNKIYIVALMIIYAIYPINALYSITMWKDIPFAGTMVLLIICLIEFAINAEKLFESKVRMTVFTILLIMTILFRNNGIYVIILLLPFLFWFEKKYWKKILAISIIVLSTFAIYKYGVFKLMNVSNGSIREALSIPLQQFARIEREKKDELSQEELDSIHKFLPVDNIAQIYTPKISDPVKNNFKDSAFKENKIEFAQLYLHFAFKYPIETAESFVSNSFGYYYPEAIHWVVAREVYQTSNEKEQKLQLKQSAIIEGTVIKEIDSIIDRRDIPIVSMVFSIGFTFWVTVISLGYAVYLKRYNLIIVYMPILILWLTTLASPVYCEFRYVYSLFTCIGLLVSTNFIKNK